MESNQDQSEQAAIDQIYNYVANLLISEKLSPEEVIQKLIYHGLSEKNADVLVHDVYNEIRHAKKQKARKDMLHGFFWLAGGSIITALTYMGANDGGGAYFVFWGAIIFGGYQFLRGLFSSH